MSSLLQNEVDLPVIDISQFTLDCEEDGGLEKLQNHSMVATVREACKEWGFFRVVNAGIPTDLLQSVENVSYELCAMPAEVKDRLITSEPSESYLRLSVRETFCIMKLPHSDSLQEFCHKIWPEEGNQKFCETIRKYVLAMSDLQRKLIKIVLAGLGLDVKAFYDSDFQDCTAYIRITHYFSNEKSREVEESLLAHTDISCLTILYQDNEGGLQIQSIDGKWLDVKPMSSSFVVNVGDSLKAWSNCRYRSAEHRVVYKGWKDRLSMAWFAGFPDDKVITAPVDLVNDHHPRRYKPFTFSEFKRASFNNLISPEKNPLTFIDSYAGLSLG